MGLAQPLRCIVLGHRWVIATLVVMPVLVVLGLGIGRTHSYSATARIQATSATLGSDVEADSVLNRVRGIATGPAVVAQALRRAHIGARDPAQVAAHEIAVSRLGSSPVMDITVVDRSPAVARRLASALATTIVGFLADPTAGSANSLTAQLQAQQRALLSEREQLFAQLAATPPSRSATLSARLATVEQEIADLVSTLRQLQVDVGLAGSAATISPASAARHLASNVWLDVTLAGLAGLGGGLLIAALLEIARPRFAGARAIADELEVPLLGGVRSTDASAPRTSGQAALLDRATVLAVRGAARAAAVSSVVLVGPVPEHVPDFVTRLQFELAGREHPSPNGRVPRTSTITAPDAPIGVAHHAETDAPAPAPAGSAVATVVAPARPHAGSRGQLRIVALDHADTHGTGSRDRGLLVTARGYTSANDLRRVRDLAQAAAWPVLGVLDVTTRRRRRSE